MTAAAACGYLCGTAAEARAAGSGWRVEGGRHQMLLINIHTGGCWGPTLDTGDLFNRYPGHAASSGCCTKVVSFLPSSANTTLALRTQRGSGGCEDKAAVFSGCSKHGAGAGDLHPSSHTLAPVTRPHTAQHYCMVRTCRLGRMESPGQNNRKLCGHGWDWEQAGLVSVSCKL